LGIGKNSPGKVSVVCYIVSLNACTYCDPVCTEIESVRSQLELQECGMQHA
jgi:hypothetical protein